MIPFSKTDNAVTVVIQGVPHSVPKGDLRFGKVISGIKDQISELDMMALLQDVPATTATGRSEDEFFAAIKVVEGVEYNGHALMFDGMPQNEYTNQKARALFKEGFSLVPLANFVKRTAKLESYRVRESLLEFLDYGELPLMDDGRFVAYKKVQADFRDIHSGTFDNSPGQVVAMLRRDVDDNPNHTCSTGLHVCSHRYLASFGRGAGDRVVACAVAPEDVVSIPVDYNHTKMRCAGYEVLSELVGWQESDVLGATAQFVDEDDEDIFVVFERDEDEYAEEVLARLERGEDEDEDGEGWTKNSAWPRFSEAMGEIEVLSSESPGVSYRITNRITGEALAFIAGAPGSNGGGLSSIEEPQYKGQAVENGEVVEWAKFPSAADAYQWGHSVLKRRLMATVQVVHPDGAVYPC